MFFYGKVHQLIRQSQEMLILHHLCSEYGLYQLILFVFVYRFDVFYLSPWELLYFAKLFVTCSRSELAC
jgi:hypothetical protein